MVTINMNLKALEQKASDLLDEMVDCNDSERIDEIIKELDEIQERIEEIEAEEEILDDEDENWE